MKRENEFGEILMRLDVAVILNLRTAKNTIGTMEKEAEPGALNFEFGAWDFFFKNFLS